MKSFKLCCAAGVSICTAALLGASVTAFAAAPAPTAQTSAQAALDRVALNPQPLPPKAQTTGSERLVVGPPYSPPVGQGPSPLAQRGIIIVGGKRGR